MSTKTSLRYGDAWHLYTDVLEPDAVYLNMENLEFSASGDCNNTNVTVRFDLNVAIELGLVPKG